MYVLVLIYENDVSVKLLCRGDAFLFTTFFTLVHTEVWWLEINSYWIDMSFAHFRPATRRHPKFYELKNSILCALEKFPTEERRRR